MLTKQQFTDSVMNEIRIIKHLFGKIPAGTYGFKPTAGQRTTLELLQYLSGLGSAAANAVRSGDRAIMLAGREKAHAVTPDTFLAAMDAQAAEIKKVLGEMTDAELAEEIDLWGSGHKQTKAAMLVHLIFKGFVSYKMQLFQYIKISGNEAVGTSDLWQGQDAKK